MNVDIFFTQTFVGVVIVGILAATLFALLNDMKSGIAFWLARKLANFATNGNKGEADELYDEWTSDLAAVYTSGVMRLLSVISLLPIGISVRITSKWAGSGYEQPASRIIAKRTFDLLVSSVLILVVAPSLVLVGVGILLESGGPVLYSLERIGAFGKPFKMWKLRTMDSDISKTAENSVTRLGRFLRWTGMDELPQLVNVLRGDMSFVGPAPDRQIFVELISDVVPKYKHRHFVKPGITGLAQVRVPYRLSVRTATERFDHDIDYVKRNSLWLDLSILAETCRIILTRRPG